MKTVFAVSTIPVRDSAGAIVGWVRADLLADGTEPTDAVFFRDGTACGQAEALERLERDPSLLYPTREEAVHDGLRRLRQAAADRDWLPR